MAEKRLLLDLLPLIPEEEQEEEETTFGGGVPLGPAQATYRSSATFVQRLRVTARTALTEDEDELLLLGVI